MHGYNKGLEIVARNGLVLPMILMLAMKVNAQDCMECHDDPDLEMEAEDGTLISLRVTPDSVAESIHADFACIDCHTDAGDEDGHDELANVDCSICHEDAAAAHRESVHGQARSRGEQEAASCVDCHGKHNILPSSNPKSRTYLLNLAATCSRCHANPALTSKFKIPISDPLSAYRESVHGVALLSEKNFNAATCTSCHGSHDIQALDNPASSIYWMNIGKTCGQCHEDVLSQYEESVHGVAVRKGLRDAPVCTDCHGEHGVRSKKDPKSPVHPLRVSAVTCGRCHNSEMITQRYGLAQGRVTTFEESYHGLAIRGGSLTAANCASCHGIHNILPSSDPRSLVHPGNLKTTCGGCHPNISENVAKGAVHLTTSTLPGRTVQLVGRFYIALIVVVIAGMMVHNAADFVSKSKRKIRDRDRA